MRCVKCGNKIGKSDRYCAICGAEQNAGMQQNRRNSTETGVIFLLALVVGILLIILGILVWRNRNHKVQEKVYNLDRELNGSGGKSGAKGLFHKFNNKRELDAFINKTNGIWADLNDLRGFGTGEIVFDFAMLSDGTLGYYTYPGSGSRLGTITDIDRNGDSYTLTFHYDAEEYMGDMYDEEEETVIFVFTEDSFYNREYPEYIYTYVGATIEDAAAFVSDYAKSNIDAQFDKVSFSAPFLGSGITDVLMNNRGVIDGPNGPNGYYDVYKNNAVGFYHLSNYESMDVYTNYPGSMNQYIGAVDGTVVFFGETVDFITVSRIIPAGASGKEPAVYKRSNAQNPNVLDYMAVWKIDNGYMIIQTLWTSASSSFYDQPASTVSYVSDLKYLSFIQ